MPIVEESYQVLDEDVVESLAIDAVFGGLPLYTSFPNLRSSRVTTLTLLFFCAPTGHNAIFRLAASPGAGHIQSLSNYKAFELRADLNFSVLELSYIAAGLARLDHALSYAHAHGLIDRTLARAWYPQAIQMPAGDTAVVFELLSQASRNAVSHQLDFLFPYEWPPFGVDSYSVAKDAKLRFTFPICATLSDEPVETLRHYLFDREDEDLLVLAKLSRNSVTATIGDLLNNTPSWVDRYFSVGQRPMVRLLGALRTLEYGLVMLSELKVRGLA